MHPYLNILGRNIGTYALCSVAGLLICGFAAARLSRRYGYSPESIILLILSICAGIFIGGHALYGVTHFSEVAALIGRIGACTFKEFLSRFTTLFGGQVYYGGFIGALIAICIHTKYSKKLRRGPAFDIFAVLAPLFHAFGRVGCFMGGCCYGIEASWGFVYHNALSPEANGVMRVPVQLIEAGFNLLIFAALLALFIKRRCGGKLIYIYMLIYPAVRFALEFLRGDAIRGALFGLSTSQWISIILFAFAAIKLIFAKNRFNPDRAENPAR